MSLLDTASIFKYHNNLSRKFEQGDVRNLGWSNLTTQQLRFTMLSQLADFDNCSVLDAGCGYADLCVFLKNKFPTCRYYGIDQIPEFILKALQDYGNMKDVVLFQGDFEMASLPVLDYTLASGLLSYKNSNPLYVFEMIQKLFIGCRLGLAFNLLSTEPENNSLLNAYDKNMIFSFCKTLTPKCSLHDDYLENDYTIFMYH
jgi:SAM-dependent methyltransferase